MKKLAHPAWFGHGASAFAVVLDRWLASDVVTGLIAAVAIGFYVRGMWDWAGQFGLLTQNTQKNRRVVPNRRLQVVASGLVGISLALFCLLAYLWQRPPLSAEQTESLERYRRFYENADPQQRPPFIEMSDSDLVTRTRNAYTRLRAMSQHYEAEDQNIQRASARGEISPQVALERTVDLMNQAGREYEDGHRVEAQMLLRVLRSRIPIDARKHIVMTPLSNVEINPKDRRAGQVNVAEIAPPIFAAGTAGLLANELEQLSRLLEAP
jgi:hypothetical protein